MRDHTMRNEKYLKDRDELIRKKTERQHDHTHTHTNNSQPTETE
jgi:hypothetical protein